MTSDSVTTSSSSTTVPVMNIPQIKRTKEEEATMQKAFFEQIRRSACDSIPQEQQEHLRKLGEKFHQSFLVETQQTSFRPTNEIMLEESLAYLIENVKAGLHPKFLTVDEVHLLRAGLGDEWYETFHYTKDDIPSHLMNVE